MLIVLQAKRMGRKPAGEKKLSITEKQKRYHEKNKEILKEKDKLRKRKSREKFMKDFPLLHKEKVKQDSKRRKERRQKNPANKNIDEEPLVVNMKFPAISRSLKQSKSSLPNDRAQKRAVVKALFEVTIPVTPRKSKLLSAWSKVKGRQAFLRDETKEKLDSFLSRNDISFTLPGRNHQVYVGKDVNGDCQYQNKEYLLWTYQELVGLLQTEDDEELSSITFSTLYRYVSPKKEYVRRSKIPQANCLCPDCENVELLCTGINKCCESMEIPTKCHDLALDLAFMQSNN